MAGSGVVSRGAADGSISCGAAGSSWRLWQRSEERAEHPARVRARGEEETPAQSIRETGTGSKQTPPAAPRGRLITNLAGGGGGAGGRAVPPPRAALPPPRPREHLRRRERRRAPQRGGGGSRGREAACPRAGAVCEGTVGAGEVAGRAVVSGPQGILALESPQAPAKGAAGPWA